MTNYIYNFYNLQLSAIDIRNVIYEMYISEWSMNIGIQVDLTPWVGILRPVTPRHVAKVISVMKGHHQFRAMKTP